MNRYAAGFVIWSVVLGLQAAKARPVVVLDPGHGGKARGAEGYYGVYEKVVTLKIALYLKEFLEEKGIDVVLTRTGDWDLPLKMRSNVANTLQACCFVSIHCNASLDLSPSGVETWVYGNGVNPYELDPTRVPPGAKILIPLAQLKSLGLLLESLRLAMSIQHQLVTLLRPVKDRGVKRAGYAVLHYCKRPAVVVETGFITNPTEGKRLLMPGYQRTIARAIGRGIIKFLQNKGSVLQVISPRGRSLQAPRRSSLGRSRPHSQTQGRPSGP